MVPAMRALILTLLITGLMQASNLGSGMLAGHFLGAAGRGELEAAKLWPTTIAYVALFGLSDAVLFASAGRRHPVGAVFAAGLWLGVLLSLLGVVAGLFFVLPWAYADQRAEVRTLANAMLSLIPITILGLVFQELLRGNGRMGAWNAMRFVLAVGFVGFIGVAWGLGETGVTGIGWAYILANALPMALALAIGLSAGWGGLSAPGAAFSMMARYGARLHASTVVAMINGKIDQMLIQLLMPPADLGLYVIAGTYAQITVTLANSVAMVAFPRACAAPAAERGAVVGTYLRLSLLLMLGSSAVLWIAAPLALRLMFGADFAAAAPVARVLILGVVALSVKEFFLLAFKAFDRTLAMSKGELATLAVNAALLALLVRPFGLMGAAVAFVAVRWISVVYLGWLLRRDLAIDPASLFRPTRADRDLLVGLLGRVI